MAHMTRAVLEGVAFGLKDSFELIRADGVTAREVRASGGGAKSALWRQILADVLNAPLTTASTTEGAAYGGAVLAAVGAGLYPDVQTACAAMISTGDVTQPQQPEAYTHAYERYRGLYPALKETFQQT
jgi:xylulokinase